MAERTVWRKSTKSPVRTPAATNATAGVDSSRDAKAAALKRSGGTVRWTLLDAAAVLAVLLFTVYAKSAVLGMSAIALMPFSGRVVVRVFVLAAFYAIQIGFLWFLASRRGTPMLEAFGLRRPGGDARPGLLWHLGSMGLVVALFLGVEAFSVGYGMAVEALGWSQPARLANDLTAVFGSGITGVALSALLVAFIAPLAEELAFRGVVMNALGEKWGMWPAVLVSAVLFAASHMNAWMFLPTFALGVALAWVAWRRRSLGAAIWLHVLYNTAAVASAYLLVR